MSRRLRLEEERLKHLQEDEEEVEDKHDVQLKRIHAPLLWKETHNGFRIIDLKEKHFPEVLEIFKNNFIQNDVLTKNTELFDDPESLQSFSDRLMIYLKGITSIAAIDINYKEPEEEEKEQIESEEVKPKQKKKKEDVVKIAGVLITSPMIKQDCGPSFSRVRLVEGPAMKKCFDLKSHINRKVDIFANFNCDSFLKYYDVCVLPEYRKKGLGRVLMRCGVDVARSLNIPVVSGIFTNYKLQNIAKGLGMEIMYEVNYVFWRDVDGDLIFDDPGAGNYSCAIMAGLVPPAPERVICKLSQADDLDKPHKMTRLEKRMASK